LFCVKAVSQFGETPPLPLDKPFADDYIKLLATCIPMLNYLLQFIY